MRMYVVSFCCLLMLCLLPGCSDKVPFGGKVTYSDDGSPLTTGIVVFTTETYSARGQLQADGTYRITSESKNDGLPPGEYRVYVMGARKPSQDKTRGPIPVIDPKRASPETTDLVVEVQKGLKAFDFTVDRFTSE